jgi:methylated-DNA-[protein]-cysteine S-methyltransferase
VKSIYYYQTEIGPVGIADNGGAITHLVWNQNKLPAGIMVRQTSLLNEAARQLFEYLAGKRRTFELPTAVAGTPFQLSVWEALQTISYGETRSYKDIAEAIGKPTACRAVGMANHQNPIAIIIPCHRVIGSDGKLVGYAGGLTVKEQLLTLEKRNSLI